MWKAALKLIKYYLKRVVGNHLFTFEELSRSLSRIKSILNFRSLTPISSDLHDLRLLTVEDFLIEELLVHLSEQNITYVPQNRLTRWQLIR